MNASCTERQRGFTLVELVAVLVLIGILAAVALPRLSVVDAFRSEGWRDQVVAGLRLAQATAAGHRRLVCAQFSGSSLSLTLATANPASVCSVPLPGPDGAAAFGATAPSAGTSVVVAPAAALYFQPNGQVTSDGAGTTVASFTISATDLAPINVYGASGHVE
jgi:prepilin-type N-terminal cleavage/methylation domain-containing protein